MKQEKEYIIKVGDLYLKNIKVDFLKVKTEFIKELQLTTKEGALIFVNYEDAEAMRKKVFLITGAPAGVIEYNEEAIHE